MTSLHRLIAIIIIWLVVAFMGAVMQGLALSLTANMITLLVVATLFVAGAATWGLARAASAVR